MPAAPPKAPRGRAGTPTTAQKQEFEKQHPRGAKGRTGGGEWIQKGQGMQGQPDERVSHLQNRLNHLGYRLTSDGRFGPQTESTVRQFQADHGLQQDGIIGPATTSSLRGAQPGKNLSTAGPKPNGGAPDPALGTPVASAASAGGGSSAPASSPVGSTGSTAYGAAYSGSGGAANVAKQNFELTGDSNLDKKGTQNASGVTVNSKGQPVKSKGSRLTSNGHLHLGDGMGSTKGDSSVGEFQALLDSLGYDLGSGGVDGRFGRDTFNALKKFQRRYGMNPTGVLGPQVRRALLHVANREKAMEKAKPGSTLEQAAAQDHDARVHRLTESFAEGSHPRGRDGKWIAKHHFSMDQPGGMDPIRVLKGTKVRIIANHESVNPTIETEHGDRGQVGRSALEPAAAKKAPTSEQWKKHYRGMSYDDLVSESQSLPSNSNLGGATPHSKEQQAALDVRKKAIWDVLDEKRKLKETDHDARVRRIVEADSKADGDPKGCGMPHAQLKKDGKKTCPGCGAKLDKLEEAKLDSGTRDDLPTSAFAIPEERKFPIHDESHARNALSRAAGTKYEGRVRAAVKKRYPKIGMQEATWEALLDDAEAFLMEAADSLIKASTHKHGLEVKKGKKDNWVERTGPGGAGGQLPAYIQHIALAIEKGGKSKSQAIAIAIGTVKRWAAGGGKVDATTRAAAAKALAEWTALKARAHAS